VPSRQPKARFFPNAKRSLNSLFNLVTDPIGDGFRLFRLMFRSRTGLTAKVLFLRKQLALGEEWQTQPRRSGCRIPEPF
jgi:hypothetical protein